MQFQIQLTSPELTRSRHANIKMNPCHDIGTGKCLPCIFGLDLISFIFYDVIVCMFYNNRFFAVFLYRLNYENFILL